MLELKLTPPTPLPMVKIHVGQSFPVAAKILADNITACEVFLRFNQIVLEEVSGHSNPRRLAGPFIDDEVQWELQGKKAVVQTSVRVEARANGLPQLSDLSVEITQ